MGCGCLSSIVFFPLRHARVSAFLLLLLVIPFVVHQNTERTELHFLTWSVALPRVALILGSLAFGLAIGLLLSWKLAPIEREDARDGTDRRA